MLILADRVREMLEKMKFGGEGRKKAVNGPLAPVDNDLRQISYPIYHYYFSLLKAMVSNREEHNN